MGHQIVFVIHFSRSEEPLPLMSRQFGISRTVRDLWTKKMSCV